MKKEKWMEGLPKNLIDQILSFNPDKIDYWHEEPKYTVFRISNNNEEGMGISICSVLDGLARYGGKGFNHREGKIRAAARAMIAMRDKRNSMPIRINFHNFLFRRFPKQIELLRDAADRFPFKSLYTSKYFLDNWKW